jgi:ketosteroid isomerase-like protein
VCRDDRGGLSRVVRAFCGRTNLIWTHSSARVDTKANFLKALAAGSTRYLEIKRSDEKFRVHGNFAVITGLAEMHAVVNGSEKQLRNRYTSIWCRRNGAWKMIMSQSTAVGTRTRARTPEGAGQWPPPRPL